MRTALEPGQTAGTRTRLSLLDAFELAEDDNVLRLPLTAQRLLAFLGLRRRPLLRAHVAGSLWPDASEERAHASLRSALWRLRRPGRALVEAQAGRVALAPDVEVDVRELVEIGRRALAATGDVDADAEAAAALTSLRGELLPDWYEDWVVVERERLDQLRLHALEALAERLAGAGRYGAAGEAALAAIEADSLRESAHRALIRVHLAEGNAAAALRQYRFYRRLSEETLGLPPSARMEELMRAAAPVTRR